MIPPLRLQVSRVPHSAGAEACTDIRSASCGRFRSRAGRDHVAQRKMVQILHRFRIRTALAVGSALLFIAGCIVAATLQAAAAPLAGQAPPSLADLATAPPSREITAEFGAEKRREAMRAAALAYGSRGALARRGWQINSLLETLAPQLSRVYRFRSLLVRHGEFSVLPPVAVETASAFRLDAGGRKAATARRIIRIVAPERIVSAPPHWRDYLVRQWRPPAAPVSVLFPRTPEEEELWRTWLADGWQHGTALANDVFASDLDRLNRDFEGMVLWRRLARARMATSPTVTSKKAPVAGDGRAMRVDETVGALGAPVRLNLQASDWRPLPTADPEADR